jgi:hypothetical protein
MGTASRKMVTHAALPMSVKLYRLPRIRERRDCVAGLSARKFGVHGIPDVGKFQDDECGVFRCFDVEIPRFDVGGC